MPTNNELPLIGILSIIGPELRALKIAFGFTERDRVYTGAGTFGYEKEIETTVSGRVRVLLWCIGTPGNTASAADSARLVSKGVKFFVLCGIAAGFRSKVKIGDIVIPRAIVDTTIQVAEDRDLKNRPLMSALMKGVTQMNCAVEIEPSRLHEEFLRLKPKKIAVPSGKEDEYKENVAVEPSVHESAILTANLLVRDPSIIIDSVNDLHQQIRAAEMEAGGFVNVCMNEYPPVPWFVVRGISDFGDDFKNDLFHDMAAKAAAAYVYLYVTEVVDLKIWREPLPMPETGTATTPIAFLHEIVSQVESSELVSGKFPSLNLAFTVTFAYLSQLTIPDALIDPTTRLQLSMLWHRAAAEVKLVDPQLHEICFKKSGYWVDPSRWDTNSIKISGFSYLDLLERLQQIGFADSSSTEWPFTVELDDQCLEDHLILESVTGQWTNSVAPESMSPIEINKAISDIVKTPSLRASLPSFLLGPITVRVNEKLYRKWRQKQFISLTAEALEDETHSLKTEIPLGKHRLISTFKPSYWNKISKCFDEGDTINLDIEMPDGSICTVDAQVEQVTLNEKLPTGAARGEVELIVETSDRLFSMYKAQKRIMCHCGATIEKVRECIFDALHDNGWSESQSSSEPQKELVYNKELELTLEGALVKVSFEATIRLEFSGPKSVIYIEISDITMHKSKAEVLKLAKVLAKSINSNLH